MSDPEDYKAQIRKGQFIVTDHIRKGRSDYASKINAMEWDRSSEDISARLHTLILLVGNERYRMQFLGQDLADAPETIEIRCKLKQQIDEFFRTL